MRNWIKKELRLWCIYRKLHKAEKLHFQDRDYPPYWNYYRRLTKILDKTLYPELKSDNP